MNDVMVWFSNNRICAVMPSLIFYEFSSKFIPMWREESASFESNGAIVCIDVKIATGRGMWGIIRVGRGGGRHGNEKFFFVDFKTRSIVRVKHGYLKIPNGDWILYIVLPSYKTLYFKWDKYVLVKIQYP